MTDLIAIAYPDTTTALAAMDEVHKLQSDLVIQADAVATIVCDKDGKYKTTTNHHSVGRGAMWGLFWGVACFAVPILAVGANPLTALLALLANLTYVLAYTPMKQHSHFALHVGDLMNRRRPWLGMVGRKTLVRA